MFKHARSRRNGETPLGSGNSFGPSVVSGPYQAWNSAPALSLSVISATGSGRPGSWPRDCLKPATRSRWCRRQSSMVAIESKPCPGSGVHTLDIGHVDSRQQVAA